MFISALYILLVLLTAGCASPQKAIYLAPSFNEQDIKTITVLPIVDSRAQRYFDVKESELQNIVYPVVETGLSDKGYGVEFSDDTTGLQCLKFGRTRNVDTDCLRTVGPDNSRWVLVLFLQDFQMRATYGGAVSTKMSGVFVDKTDGAMLWYDLEYTGLSQRELVGKNRDTALAKDVIQNCALKLIDSFPKKNPSSSG